MTLPLPFTEAPPMRPLSVHELTEAAKSAMEHAFPQVWVEGEISNFRAHSSGHWYFALKDRLAQLRCAMYRTDNRRLPTEPTDGLKVYAQGRLTVYPAKGEMQFVVKHLLATTEGGFYAIALEKARRSLEKDGLLDPSRKRQLPAFPRSVGVVSSPDGAAWRDIVAVVERRWPLAELVLIGAQVQGEGAPRDICRALALANRCGQLDVLIVGRGGGSKEDLWAFNDERVARAVAASRVPTISAVGHETDVTLTDLVADLRAPTPSAAAEKAVPDHAEVEQRLAGLGATLASTASRRIELVGERLRHAALRMASRCEALVAERRSSIERWAAALDALSPLKVLDRGYAVARDAAGRVLRRVADFPAGQRFSLRVADGDVNARSEAGA